MKQCREYEKKVTTKISNLCNSCLHNPKQSNVQCGLCGNDAGEMPRGKLRIIKRHGDLSILRCEECGYQCGTCEEKINADEAGNSRILWLGHSTQYLRCGDCPDVYTSSCLRCRRVKTSVSLKNSSTFKYPPSVPECTSCKQLSNYEKKLSDPQYIFSQYNHKKQFKNSNPMVVEIMKEIPKFIDDRQLRRDVKLIQTDEELIISTVKINAINEELSRNHKHKMGYHRSWKKVLDNYEKYLKKNFQIARSEIDTWKIRGRKGTAYENNSYFNYPIIIHYHLLVV